MGGLWDNLPTDTAKPICDGRCIYAYELLEFGGHGVAIPDPACSLHGEPDWPEGPFTPEEEETLPLDEKDCQCWWTDPSTWLSAASCGYGGGYEPGSQREHNPNCPVHT